MNLLRVSTSGSIKLYFWFLLGTLTAFNFEIAHAHAHENEDFGPKCAKFFWAGTPDNPNSKTFLMLNGYLDKRKILLQLDTASFDSIIKYNINNSSLHSSGSRTSHLLQIGEMTWGGAQFSTLGQEQKSKSELYGTAGSSLLLGLVTIIDYPAQRLCFYRTDKKLVNFQKINWQPALFREGWLLIGGNLGNIQTKSLVFDTGSSLFDLVVPELIWKRITGKSGIQQATFRKTGNAWGKPVTIYGAPSVISLTIGGEPRNHIKVWVAPSDFAQYPVHPDGIVGNAAFLDSIVAIDLTNGARFALLSK
ncbi:hypothetical protein [Gluconobacter kondonii]|uniref:hypothetical protein n=1 Tax=Gluconobacter kondonii TaxID=941463 RepID=UPI001B8A8ECF|nr:hypothetical protein [Gluconobacter kondonii]MBS1058186.1 hypothetical protein [Gluconobacter kondonii]